MDTETMIKQNLLRADLPINEEHIDLALGFLNDRVEEVWYRHKADFRTSWGTITTVKDADEYMLNKWCDDIIKNSLRGPSTNARHLKYLDPSGFFRIIRDTRDETGNPYVWTYGQLVGIDKQMVGSDRLEVYSALANKTGGTVDVTAGSITVTGTATEFTQDDEGKRFKKDGDTKSYIIAKVVTATELELEEKYRGFTTSASNYKIGDVGVLVTLQGFVGGQLDSEIVELEGSDKVTSLNTFSSATSISKNAVTGGAIVVRQFATPTTIIGTLSPIEYEIQRKTIKLWPIPSSSEVLNYRFWMHHPQLRHKTDRVLLPKKYHFGLSAMLEADLRGWANKDIPAALAEKVEQMWALLNKNVNSTEQEDTIMHSDEFEHIGNYFNTDIDFYNDVY